MHIFTLLFTLQVILTIGRGAADKLPPDFKKIESTKELFSVLPCTKEPAPSAEELQAIIKEVAEEKEKRLKEMKPQEVELEKQQLEYMAKLLPQSTGGSATPETASSPSGTAVTTPKPATTPGSSPPLNTVSTSSKPIVSSTGSTPQSSAVETTPKAVSSPGSTPPAVTAPKGGKLLRRHQMRLSRRSYTIGQPFVKLNEEIVIDDMKFVRGQALQGGATGQIYLATMTTKKDKTPKTVVMKAVPRLYKVDKKHPQGGETERFLSLRREFEAMTVVHKRDPFAHICVIQQPIAYREEKDRSYLIMEYAEGGALVDYLPDNFANLHLDARYVIKQIILGVLAMHRTKLGHRDLKPDNIFIRKTSTGYVPIVADLGNATPLDSKERSDPGTAIYAAPEYWLDGLGAVDFEKTDAFSVGAILYTILFREHPKRQPLNLGKVEAYGAFLFNVDDFVTARVDPDAGDLIQRLCWPDPKRRMSLAAALNHPYLNVHMGYEEYLKTQDPHRYWDDNIYGFKVLTYSYKIRARATNKGQMVRPVIAKTDARKTLRLPIKPDPEEEDESTSSSSSSPTVGYIAPPNTPRDSTALSGTEAPPNTPRGSGSDAPPNSPRSGVPQTGGNAPTGTQVAAALDASLKNKT